MYYLSLGINIRGFRGHVITANNNIREHKSI